MWTRLLKPAFLLVLVVLAVSGWLKACQTSPDTPTIVADTVYLDNVPPEVKTQEKRARSLERSTKEKLVGVKVTPPEQGDGPVVVFREAINTDTAISHLRMGQDGLYIRLQVPDSVGKSHLVQLPRKQVSRCNKIEIGGNGTLRCDEPVLGVWAFEWSAHVGVGSDSVGLEDRVGLGWKRYRSSRWGISAYTKPSDRLTGGPWVYVGASGSTPIWGHR